MTMTTDRTAVTTDVDLAPITDAVRRAAATLRTTDSDPLDAVGWASAHVAAVERTLLPAADRVGDGLAGDTRSVRRINHHLQHELRKLEQTSSGDALTVRTDVGALRRHVIELLDELTAAEIALFTPFLAILGPGARGTLVASYEHALAVAPTRPHPYAPRRGLLGMIAFRLEAVRDRALNTMDGRHAPVGKPRRSVPEPGRWGQYLLGGARPADD